MSFDTLLTRLGFEHSYDRFLLGKAMLLRHVPANGQVTFDVLCQRMQSDCARLKSVYADFHFCKLVGNTPIAEILQGLYNTCILQAHPLNDVPFDPNRRGDWRGVAVKYTGHGREYAAVLRRRAEPFLDAICLL